MIFVTVGNARQRFRRLVDAVDKLANEGFFDDEPVVIQCGHDHDFRPLRCKHIAFVPLDAFTQIMRDATLVISHGGAGALHHAFLAGKIPVVMPRLKKYGEHVDDNQIDLVRILASEGRLVPAYEPEDLSVAVPEARHRNHSRIHLPPVRMLSLVAEAIEELAGPR